MLEFNVPDMSCEHCAKTIRAAVANVDRGATCDIDIGAKRVRVASQLPPSDIAEALEDAGYKSIFVPSVG